MDTPEHQPAKKLANHHQPYDFYHDLVMVFSQTTSRMMKSSQAGVGPIVKTSEQLV